MGEWQTGIQLPPASRKALAAPLRDEVSSPLPLREAHTLPVDRQIWSVYAGTCGDRVKRLCEQLDAGPNGPDFDQLRQWVEGLLEGRQAVLSLVLALAPFEPFDDAAARGLVGALDWRLLRAAEGIESGAAPQDAPDDPVPTGWLDAGGGCPADEVLPRAFGLPRESVCDAAGEFSAARVLSAFYLNLLPLRRLLAPHLASLGLPRTDDVLVGASAIGWVLSAEDQVAAYCSADTLLAAFSGWPTDARHVRAALDFLKDAEPAARQGRGRVNRLAVAAAAQDEPGEARMLALAEMYKTLVEGPFRRYAWVLHCLRVGQWGDVPMLTSLRNTLIAGGGWPARLASQAVLTQARNGMAHETLYWDGSAKVFVSQGQQIPAEQLVYASVLLDAFARGCEAATACYSAWAGANEVGAVMRPDETGRLAPWRRAEANFGTNGLALQHADFNAAVASITCAALIEANVNPCFQALVACHRLLPHVERFDVRVASAPHVVISVGAGALERTGRVWDLARSHFDYMPLAAFLPANLEARQARQPRGAAVRAVAWIAIDDVMDALDGSPDPWRHADAVTFTRRVEVAALAVEECLAMLPRQDQNELLGVQARLTALRKWLRAPDRPVDQTTVDDLKHVRRMRHWFDAWGPVERLPGIARMPAPAVLPAWQQTARLKESDWILPWQTF